MNGYQKIVLLVVIAGVIAMLLYPPFHFLDRGGGEINMGYAFLFNPPAFPKGTVGAGMVGSVDTGMLMTQWLGVLIVGGIAFFMLRGR
ncbi:MAG: hypothetical protein EPN55_07945 [Gammaproteobacteria bacterium]|nr:MAG: hypothetical protein EPN55_07945 [Gammaproteobacteria bacterium]